MLVQRISDAKRKLAAERKRQRIKQQNAEERSRVIKEFELRKIELERENRLNEAKLEALAESKDKVYVGDLARRAINKINNQLVYERKTYQPGKARSVSWVARCMKVNAMTVHNWLRFNVRIPIHRLDQLMEVMELNVLDLIHPDEMGTVYGNFTCQERYATRQSYKDRMSILFKQLDTIDRMGVQSKSSNSDDPSDMGTEDTSSQVPNQEN